jgi:aryl-alcohol dehydrogenase-like predicted oxidoreductase
MTRKSLQSTLNRANSTQTARRQHAPRSKWGRIGDDARTLAWLLHRPPNILLIPGTSSRKHLRENLKAASLQIPAELVVALDSIGAPR